MSCTIEDLERSACLYWPTHLSDIVTEISSVPVLLKTQDHFLSIIKMQYKIMVDLCKLSLIRLNPA